jgi:hypothetical protein
MMLAMPDETMVESAISSIDAGNIRVTAARAFGPTKAPSKMASTTVSRPLMLVRKTMGRAVRRRTFETGALVNPLDKRDMSAASSRAGHLMGARIAMNRLKRSDQGLTG